MNRILFSFLLSFIVISTRAQNFHGQWKGYFVDKSATALSFGSDRSDYVLDLDVQDSIVTGYSYTYFSDDGKKYYTICTLKGIANKKTKCIQVIETERTKTNVPDNISNSFQVHTLTWRKEGDNEILEGTWRPAPGQGINTGYGITYLAKRQLTEISALAKRINARKDPANKLARNSPPAKPKTPVPVNKKPTTTLAKIKPPVRPNTVVAVKKMPVTTIAKANPPVKPVIKTTGTTVAKTTLLKPINTTPVADSTPKIPLVSTVKSLSPEKINFEKRDNSLLQTVIVDNATVKIELYDSGEVDGDSISLFYNGKVLLAHKMLSEKAIMLEIPVKSDDINELVMYADNLGTIPPNTALMIVYDGTKRYEVRITSDLSKSGTIRFIHNSSASAKP